MNRDTLQRTYRQIGDNIKSIISVTSTIVDDQENHPNGEQTSRERELYGFAVDLNYQANLLLKVIRELNNV